MAKITKKIVTVMLYCLIVVVAIVAVFPWFWLVLSSFKTRTDIWARPPLFIFQPSLFEYYSAFITKRFYIHAQNTIIVGLTVACVSLMIGVPAAYAFARFPGFLADNQLFFFVLTTRMAPGIVEAIPVYILFTHLGLAGTLWGVIVVHTLFNLSFVIWMMKGFFDDIPSDLDDKAMLDGCSRFQAFYKIILPLVAPGLVATAVFCLLFSWNEFLFALILTGGDARTLPVTIPGLVTPAGTYWGEIMASGTVITTPILLFAIIVQRYLVRGLTFGAVK